MVTLLLDNTGALYSQLSGETPVPGLAFKSPVSGVGS